MLGQRGPSGRQSGAGDATGPGVQMVMGQAEDGCGETALGEALPGPVLPWGTPAVSDGTVLIQVTLTGLERLQTRRTRLGKITAAPNRQRKV